MKRDKSYFYREKWIDNELYTYIPLVLAIFGELREDLMVSEVFFDFDLVSLGFFSFTIFNDFFYKLAVICLQNRIESISSLKHGISRKSIERKQ